MATNLLHPRFRRHAAAILALALAACLALPASSPAQSVPDAASLQLSIVWTAERAPDPQHVVSASYARLSQAVAQLEQFLALGTADTYRGWQSWLDLPALKAELSREAPDLAALRDIEDRYYQNQPGLEMEPFVALRRELHGYIAARQYASADAPQELFRQRLAELAECLARLESEPQGADAHRAGQLLAWLEPLSDDAARLAAAVRVRHCRTNCTALASGRLVNWLMRQTVADQRTIAETMLGSFTRGVAYTQGEVSFGFVPNPRNATLEVRLVGQTVAPSNVSQQRRVTVLGSSQTAIQAAKQVHINDQGLHLMPAAAWCSTNVQIRDVSAPGPLIQRIATRRANQMRPQAEQLASQRTAAEARSNLDQQAESALAGANETFCNNIRAPLLRMGCLPTDFRFWSDHYHLRFMLSQHSREQLAVATPPPALSAEYDIGGAVHESMINNLAESLLGGQTAEDLVWHDVMQVITGRAARPLWVHDRSERWSVTFASERPVLARFDGGRIGVTLRLDKVTRGQRQFEHPVAIEATFLPEVTDEGPAMIREGELQIRFAEGIEPESAHDWQVFLARKFGAILLDEIHFDGLVPPSGGTIGKLRELDLVEFTSARGWLTVAYQLGGQSADGEPADLASRQPTVR